MSSPDDSDSYPRESSEALTFLVIRGLSARNRLDKDSTLQEIAALWESENSVLERIMARNSQKRDELGKFHRKIEAIRAQSADLECRTRFRFASPTQERSLSSLIHSASEIEEALMPHGPMENPGRLNSICTSAAPEIAKRFQLINLTANRLEDYTHVLRKRAIAFEEGFHTAKQMASKHPNIMHLLRKYEDRLRWNEKLKLNELGHVSDPIAKRRNIAKCPGPIAVNLTLVLQRYLASNYTQLEWFAPRPQNEYAVNWAPFDEIAKDEMFKLVPGQFSANEFECVQRDDVIRRLVGDGPLTEKVNALKVLCADAESKIPHLTADVKALRGVRRSPLIAPEFVSIINQMWQVNDELGGKMAQQHTDVDEMITEGMALSHKIAPIVEEHRSLARRFLISRIALDALRRTHGSLQRIQVCHAAVTRTLFHISAAFSRNGLEQLPMTIYCQAQVRATLPPRAKPRVHVPRLSQRRGATPLGLFKLAVRRPRIPSSRARAGSRTGESSARTSPSDGWSELGEIMGLSTMKEHEALLLIARATAVQTNCPNPHMIMRKIFDHMSASIRETAQSQLAAFKEQLVTEWETIKQVSESLLVIPHATVEVQTETRRLTDACTLTFVPPKDKKPRLN
jgi:hypothetical protein